MCSSDLSFFEDVDGTLWFASQGNGVYVIREDSLRILSTKDGLNHDFVQTIVGDDGTLEALSTRKADFHGFAFHPKRPLIAQASVFGREPASIVRSTPPVLKVGVLAQALSSRATSRMRQQGFATR